MEDCLKIAYVKLGSVAVGWNKTTPIQGICVETIPMPKEALDEDQNILDNLVKLVDCDIFAKIKEEFDIEITDYLVIQTREYYRKHRPEYRSRGEYG